ncbi:hypothetical protein BB560_000892 [Smittium megazygosporum]|uniref:Pentafunctional AROM polypeptide n=1 Tax=Smittium megazygosporum TaxID=133381 RepID=A0A2T9ZJ15_9FUNG|nr:hypothetical protein BB560_000892 [Smittium megazygosporum]
MPSNKPLSPMHKIDGLNYISVLGEDSVIIGKNLIDHIWSDIFKTFAPSSAYVIITDENLNDLYGAQFKAAFEKFSSQLLSDKQERPQLIFSVIPPGERSKSREMKAKIEDQLLAASCTRNTFILALGGGVIGDLAGYVAATFMRGVRFVQIPTSLLAMVDSSVGGKTAIDTPNGKNLIGAFWQPKRVYIDLSFLKTLPEREFSNGMAEIIKSAAIWSAEEFEILEQNSDRVKRAVLDQENDEDFNLLLRVVSSSVRMKAHVVTVDEREAGLRGLLNFGHTIGHAIESTTAPYLLHGECVSIGCVLEAEIAYKLNHLGAASVTRLAHCFKLYNLPTKLKDSFVLAKVPPALVKRPYTKLLMQAMKVDKKNVGTKKRVVILTSIGDTLEEKPSYVDDDIIREIINPTVIVYNYAHELGKHLEYRKIKDSFVVTPPGSKSITNRALILAALSEGTCKLHNFLHSDDTRVMMDALTSIGACKITLENGGKTVVVTGNGGVVNATGSTLYLENAGTSSRFLTTLVNLATTKADSFTILTGNSRMKQRPIGPLVDALLGNGCNIEYMEKTGSLPIKVFHSERRLEGGSVKLSASISSQYVSSLLMCAPYAETPITLELVGDNVISQPYIDMTVAMMSSFGILVERVSKNTYFIPQGRYSAPPEYEIESDASSATYPLAIAAALSLKCTIPNIGSNSLQGDAHFAVDVLQKMGCEVHQTETTTAVKGPPIGSLVSLGEIDMENMTDAFLTAAVLAAVATSPDPSKKNVTKIRGIANQHVKECDRIEAMVAELGKVQVRCVSHEDGIDVYGVPVSELCEKSYLPRIYCYDDHRVAMSMSILGLILSSGLIIEDRNCVSKTWPNWWTCLSDGFGFVCSPYQLENLQPYKTADQYFDMKPITSVDQGKPVNKNIVLVGMRGVGKTTLGQAIAAELGYKFIDMDQYLEKALGRTIPDIVTKDGWDAFREQETSMLKHALSFDHPTDTIISCGGGIVESSEAVDYLTSYKNNGGIVLHLYADIDHVSEYLGKDVTRPAYATGKSPKETFLSRLPLYSRVSSNTFYVCSEEPFGWVQTIKDLTRMSKFLLGKEFNQVNTVLDRSFFLSLTYPDLSNLSALEVNELVAGCNAVELRVDLLLNAERFSNIQLGNESQLAEFRLYVLEQVSMLRRRTSLPIIYTIRTKEQGGKFSDVFSILQQLLLDGINYGCEYVDVEMSEDESLISSIASQKQNSLVIASYHDLSGLKLRWDNAEPGSFPPALVEIATKYADILKLISVSLEWDDNLRCLMFIRKHQITSHLPLIALNMGLCGQLSRVMNPFLTPVTHPLLPTSAAPGQLSVQEITRTLSTMGAIPPRKFFLLGDPISASPSPAMHNAAFKAIGLPHKYLLYPINLKLVKKNDKEYASLSKMLRSTEFGGASVTIPNKEIIGEFLDELTPAAKAIGAVNTVILADRFPARSPSAPATQFFRNNQLIKLIGDNTDYLGIVRSLNRANRDSLTSQCFGSTTSALVIGAGGTARAALYALYSMNIKHVCLYNRTVSKAEALAGEFSQFLPEIDVLSSLEEPTGISDSQAIPSFDIIISTIPADDSFIYPDSLFSGLLEKFESISLENEKSSLLSSSSKHSRFVLDMAYQKNTTPLLKKGVENGWVTISGFQVLVEQGIEQFERWIGSSAPESVMQNAVLDHMLKM